MTSSRNSVHCSVVHCNNNRTNRHLSFFSLPTDHERRKKWLKIIGRTDLMEKPNLKSKSYAVCSAHFETDMILNRPQLKLDAIPTKFLPNMLSDDDDILSTQFTARAVDIATQTQFSQVNVTSTLRIKNASSETVAAKANEENKESNTQTPLSLSSNSPRKRTLHARLKDSEQKRRKLEYDIKKIKKELEVKNNQSGPFSCS